MQYAKGREQVTMSHLISEGQLGRVKISSHVEFGVAADASFDILIRGGEVKERELGIVIGVSGSESYSVDLYKDPDINADGSSVVESKQSLVENLAEVVADVYSGPTLNDVGTKIYEAIASGTRMAVPWETVIPVFFIQGDKDLLLRVTNISSSSGDFAVSVRSHRSGDTSLNQA
ncbi:MAG: hypothetical protein GF388_08525 [Candidatus Aegiribacteria sp.]|nr:hypothetical protein [Candidatus Aegiribacteria sp.]